MIHFLVIPVSISVFYDEYIKNLCWKYIFKKFLKPFWYNAMSLGVGKGKKSCLELVLSRSAVPLEEPESTASFCLWRLFLVVWLLCSPTLKVLLLLSLLIDSGFIEEKKRNCTLSIWIASSGRGKARLIIRPERSFYSGFKVEGAWKSHPSPCLLRIISPSTRESFAGLFW